MSRSPDESRAPAARPTGPRMASADYRVQRDSPVAPCPRQSLHAGSIVHPVGQRFDGRKGAAARCRRPVSRRRSRGKDGAARRTDGSSLVRHESITRPLDGDHRDSRSPAAVGDRRRHRAGHRGNRGEHARQIARESVREHRTVRDACREDAGGVDRVLPAESIEQRANEADVIARRHLAPVVPAAIEPVRIHRQKSFPVGDPVQRRVRRDLAPGAARAVQDEYDRIAAGCRRAGGRMQDVRPDHAADLKRA